MSQSKEGGSNAVKFSVVKLAEKESASGSLNEPVLVSFP